MSNLISSILIMFGAIFTLIAAIGVLRMPDLLIRMHSATKAGTLGVSLILIGVAFHFHRTALTLEALATIIFIFITAPIASHLIARAAYFNQIQLTPSTIIDELRQNYDSSSHQLGRLKREDL